MRIFFIRHGETQANIEQRYSSNGGSPLTEKGYLQVESLTANFELNGISRIYSSPLDRCITLADKLSSKTGLTPIIDHRLREFDFGVFDNLTWKQAEKKYPVEFNLFCDNPGNYKIPDGESQLEFNGRVSLFIKEILAYDIDMAVITHAGVIRSALAEILHLNEEQRWLFKIMNASITLVEICEGHACLVLQEIK